MANYIANWVMLNDKPKGKIWENLGRVLVLALCILVFFKGYNPDLPQFVHNLANGICIVLIFFAVGIMMYYIILLPIFLFSITCFGLSVERREKNSKSYYEDYKSSLVIFLKPLNKLSELFTCGLIVVNSLLLMSGGGLGIIAGCIWLISGIVINVAIYVSRVTVIKLAEDIITPENIKWLEEP